MTDLVYILSPQSRWNDNEIRYSLRSAEKHLTGVGSVYIVGYKPPFLKGVILIPAEDEGRNKEENIYKKILTACRDERISSDFMLMNDDHFLLQDADAGTYPNYYFGTLSECLARGRKLIAADGKATLTTWKRAVKCTIEALCIRGLPEKHFDIHCPVLINRHLFPQTVGSFRWGKDGYVIKSLYANSIGLDGVPVRDIKIDHSGSVENYREHIEGAPCFSTGHRVNFEALRELLEELYPFKSKFEI